MEWVDQYVLKPLPAKEKSLAENFRALTLGEDESIYSENPLMPKPTKHKLDRFDEHSFIFVLQRQLKDYGFTLQEEREEGVLIGFSILLATQFSDWQVAVQVELNLQLEYVKYQSYPLQQLQLPSFGRDQINTIAKYLSLNFNPKNPHGCMTIDVDSGTLLYQAVNNSLSHLQRRILKAPEYLATSINAEIREVEKVWRGFLPNFLKVMGVGGVRARGHPFWRTYKEKRSPYQSQEFSLLAEYIKLSYIEHPFMFEEIEEVNGMRTLRKIRSRFLSKDDKNRKRVDYEKMMSNKHYYSYKLTSDFTALLQTFASAAVIQAENKSRKYQLPEQKKKELSAHLVVDNFESRHLLYSPLNIRQVKKESSLTRSGFSQLKLLHVLAKKMEDADFNVSPIVSKETQQSRFINETEILKVIGGGKSLFITRFFFSEAAIGTGFSDKILLQYCPLKSIDSYLHSHKRFITFETKLFFLYQVAVGLRFLRDYGIIHNDLKPQNVLLKIMADKFKVNSTFMLRLIDFGESYAAQHTALNKANKYKRGFTIPYASPEQTRYDQRFTEKIDIFSFGVMFYEIVFDAFPVQVVRKGKEVYITEENYLKFYSMAPERCRYESLPKLMQILYHLCLRCLSPHPAQRPVIDWVVAILREVLLFGDKIYLF